MIEGSPLNHEGHQEACVFCDIRDGKEPGSMIVETSDSFAIMALEGHPLVMSKKHITKEDVDKDPEILFATVQLALSLAPVVESSMGAQGITFVMNLGEAAGQEIDHAHIHVFPRMDGDGEIKYRLSLPLSRVELNSRAKRIGDAFNMSTQA